MCACDIERSVIRSCMSYLYLIRFCWRFSKPNKMKQNILLKCLYILIHSGCQCLLDRPLCYLAALNKNQSTHCTNTLTNWTRSIRPIWSQVYTDSMLLTNMFLLSYPFWRQSGNKTIISLLFYGRKGYRFRHKECVVNDESHLASRAPIKKEENRPKWPPRGYILSKIEIHNWLSWVFNGLRHFFILTKMSTQYSHRSVSVFRCLHAAP